MYTVLNTCVSSCSSNHGTFLSNHVEIKLWPISEDFLFLASSIPGFGTGTENSKNISLCLGIELQLLDWESWVLTTTLLGCCVGGEHTTTITEMHASLHLHSWIFIVHWRFTVLFNELSMMHGYDHETLWQLLCSPLQQISQWCSGYHSGLWIKQLEFNSPVGRNVFLFRIILELLWNILN